MTAEILKMGDKQPVIIIFFLMPFINPQILPPFHFARPSSASRSTASPGGPSASFSCGSFFDRRDFEGPAMYSENLRGGIVAWPPPLGLSRTAPDSGERTSRRWNFNGARIRGKAVSGGLVCDDRGVGEANGAFVFGTRRPCDAAPPRFSRTDVCHPPGERAARRPRRTSGTTGFEPRVFQNRDTSEGAARPTLRHGSWRPNSRASA
mmetsp:Transcript_10172/g.22016  ORF Transcript_10172/g.22016 Transcript_10172/m.22016 type:complete len:207 (-) Transcript_10172:429-1049(-)